MTAVVAVPRRLAIWDPAALNDSDGDLALRALRDERWPWDALYLRLHDPLPPVAVTTAVARAAHERGCPLWVRGDAARARALGAAGVHLPASARAGDAASIGGAGFALSFAVHDANEVAPAVAHAPTFLLFGHVYATPSKSGASGRGVAALAAVVVAAAPVPVLALGGVTLDRENELRAAGAFGIAAIRAAFAPPVP